MELKLTTVQGEANEMRALLGTLTASVTMLSNENEELIKKHAAYKDNNDGYELQVSASQMNKLILVD
jgi:hypothetical protein